jgi:hypothetical protein
MILSRYPLFKPDSYYESEKTNDYVNTKRL